MIFSNAFFDTIFLNHVCIENSYLRLCTHTSEIDNHKPKIELFFSVYSIN